MPRSVFRRKLIILAALLALLTSWPALAQPPGGAEPPAAGIVARLADWLAELLGDIGCSLDPNGCGSGSTAPENPDGEDLDIGCSLDPSGACGGGHG